MNPLYTGMIRWDSVSVLSNEPLTDEDSFSFAVRTFPKTVHSHALLNENGIIDLDGNIDALSEASFTDREHDQHNAITHGVASGENVLMTDDHLGELTHDFPYDMIGNRLEGLSDGEPVEEAVESFDGLQQNIASDPSLTVEGVDVEREEEVSSDDQPRSDEMGFSFVSQANEVNFASACSLLSRRDLPVNEEQPPHPPLYLSSPRAVSYVVRGGRTNKDYYGDGLNPWYKSEEGRAVYKIKCRNKSVVIEENGDIRVEKSGESRMMEYKAVHYLHPITKRVFYMESAGRMVGNVLVTYFINGNISNISPNPLPRVGPSERKQINEEMRDELLSTRKMILRHPYVPLNTIRNLRRDPEVKKFDSGRSLDNDLSFLDSECKTNEFVRHRVSSGLKTLYMLSDPVLFNIFLNDLPTKNFLSKEKARIENLFVDGKPSHRELERECEIPWEGRKGCTFLDTTYGVGKLFLTPLLYTHSEFLNESGKALGIPVAFLATKGEPTMNDFHMMGVFLSGMARDCGYQNRRVRSLCTDGADSLAGILTNSLFEDATRLRCTRHLQDNLEAASTKQMSAEAQSVLYGHRKQTNGVWQRSSGLLDEDTCSSAAQLWDDYDKDGWSESAIQWIDSHFELLYKTTGLKARLMGGWKLDLPETNKSENFNLLLKSSLRSKDAPQTVVCKLKEMCRDLADDIPMCLYGGGTKSLRSGPIMTAAIWKSNRTKKDSAMKKYGIHGRDKKEQLNLHELLLNGLTGVARNRFIESVSDLTVNRDQINDQRLYVSDRKLNCSIVMRNESSGRWNCTVFECTRGRSLKQCCHKVAALLFFRDQEGNDGPMKEELGYLVQLSDSEILKMTTSATDGEKKGSRKGSQLSAPNFSRVVTTLGASSFDTVPKEKTPTPIWFNRNPFTIFVCNEPIDGECIRRESCVTCGEWIRIGRTMGDEYDLHIRHSERFMYPNAEKKMVATIARQRTALIHLNEDCLLKRYPYMVNRRVDLSEGVKSSQEYIRLSQQFF